MHRKQCEHLESYFVACSGCGVLRNGKTSQFGSEANIAGRVQEFILSEACRVDARVALLEVSYVAAVLHIGRMIPFFICSAVFASLSLSLHVSVLVAVLTPLATTELHVPERGVGKVGLRSGECRCSDLS